MKSLFSSLPGVLALLGIVSCGVQGTVEVSNMSKGEVLTLLPQKAVPAVKKDLLISIASNGVALHGGVDFKVLAFEKFGDRDPIFSLSDCSTLCPAALDISKVGLFVLKMSGSEKSATGYIVQREDARSMQVLIDFN